MNPIPGRFSERTRFATERATARARYSNRAGAVSASRRSAGRRPRTSASRSALPTGSDTSAGYVAASRTWRSTSRVATAASASAINPNSATTLAPGGGFTGTPCRGSRPASACRALPAGRPRRSDPASTGGPPGAAAGRTRPPVAGPGRSARTSGTRPGTRWPGHRRARSAARRPRPRPPSRTGPADRGAAGAAEPRRRSAAAGGGHRPGARPRPSGDPPLRGPELGAAGPRVPLGLGRGRPDRLLGQDLEPVIVAEERLDLPVLERVVGDRHQPTTGGEELDRPGKGGGQLLELPVDLDPDRLEGPAGRMRSPATAGHGGRDHRGQLAGRPEESSVAGPDDRPGDPTGEPLLAVGPDHARQLLLGVGVHHVCGGAGPLPPPHVDGALGPA